MKIRQILALVVLAGIVLIPHVVLAADDVIRSGDIVIPADEKVLGDVISFRGEVSVYGEVFGDVVALAGPVTVYSGGVVHGDVVALIGAIDLRTGGMIGGDQVGLGGIGRIAVPAPPSLRNIRPGFTIFNLVIRVVLALLIGALFPNALARVTGKLEAQAGQCAGAGVLAWLAILPLAVVVALTIVGIPLSLLLVLALWAAYNLGFAAISMLAGKRILSGQQAGSLLALAVGAFLLSVLIAVPFMGWLVRIVLGLLGVGAVTLTRFGTQKPI